MKTLLIKVNEEIRYEIQIFAGRTINNKAHLVESEVENGVKYNISGIEIIDEIEFQMWWQIFGRSYPYKPVSYSYT